MSRSPGLHPSLRHCKAQIRDRFAAFLSENLSKNPLKCEYFLPFVVDELIREDKAEVTVLKSKDRWYGVTYREDKPVVVAAIQSLKDQGLYPQKLWESRRHWSRRRRAPHGRSPSACSPADNLP